MRPINRRRTYAWVWVGMLLAIGPGGLRVTAQHENQREVSTRPVVTSRPERTEVWLRVTAEQVQVRSRPDANSVAVTRAEPGDVLRAVDQDPYGWYRILPPEGVFSYVSAEHVDRRGPTEGIVSVRTGTLRVRVGSTLRDLDPLHSEVQMLLEGGTAVQIVGEQGGWLMIKPPKGVFAYVSGEHVERISDDVAAQLRSGKRPTTHATATPSPAPAASATRPAASGPDLTGPWGQRLLLAETAIEAEGRKPLLEQTWVDPIARLRPIAAQSEEPMVARLAQAWMDQLEQRIVEQSTVREAEEVLQRAARDRAHHQRELERLEQVQQRAASRPAFAARGELLRSYAIETAGGQRWYKLRDPLTQRIEAYVEIGPDSKLKPNDYLGQYVGVRGMRRTAPELGADVVWAEEIVALTREESPTTRPARQGP